MSPLEKRLRTPKSELHAYFAKDKSPTAIRRFTSVDIDERWDVIRPIVNTPEAVAALDHAMKYHCRLSGQTWDMAIGPWAYATALRKWTAAPDRDSPDWFRCWGGCHAMGAWHAIVGKRLLPSLRWLVVCNIHNSHTAAVGYDKKRKEAVIFDILWGMQNAYEVAKRLFDKSAWSGPATEYQARMDAYRPGVVDVCS